MSGDVINLRQARKRQNRAKRDAKAEENRLFFGRTKAEKQLTKAQKDQAAQRLEGHRLTSLSAKDEAEISAASLPPEKTTHEDEA